MARKKIINPRGIPNYSVGPVYDNGGAASFILEREFYDPVTVFRGAGRIPRGGLKVYQPAQVFFNPVTSVTGLGGIVPGQLALSPLVDTGNEGG